MGIGRIQMKLLFGWIWTPKWIQHRIEDPGIFPENIRHCFMRMVALWQILFTKVTTSKCRALTDCNKTPRWMSVWRYGWWRGTLPLTPLLRSATSVSPSRLVPSCPHRRENTTRTSQHSWFAEQNATRQQTADDSRDRGKSRGRSTVVVVIHETQWWWASLNFERNNVWYIPYRWIQRSVKIKQLQEFFKIWPLVAKILHIVWWGILFWATLYMLHRTLLRSLAGFLAACLYFLNQPPLPLCIARRPEVGSTGMATRANGPRQVAV